MGEVRLQKFLADAGLASRRKCEELISQGRVEIDGLVVTTPGTKISGSEKIKVDGKEIKPVKKKLYILLNKPVGYISTAKDQFSRKTVIDLVGTVNERVYPVGRLDYDTSGLIILTNDGDFANKMMHPRHETEKVYRAEIMGRLNERDINTIRNGIKLEDYTTAPSKLRIIDDSGANSIVELTIHEGKNRQVRKMFAALKHPVLRLKRVAIGFVRIDGLEEGKWRYLSKKEVDQLKNAATKDKKSTGNKRKKSKSSS
jgi:23S rRNA pseudouridine2605 synthase